jgi:hypothetical protein
MDLDELLAREEIRDTLARYNLSGDRGRIPELLDCFTRDASLEIEGEPPARGRAEIERRMRAAIDELCASGSDDPVRLRHHLTTSGIEVESPRMARAWSYFIVLTDIGLDHAGRYVDELRLEDDHWRLARRRVIVDWSASGTRYGRTPGGGPHRTEET